MDSTKKLSLLRQMLLIRRLEKEWAEIHRREELGGAPPALSLGQEAVSVGTCAALEPGDHVFTSHRGQGPQIGRGLEPKRILAEVARRRGGYCKGKANYHVSDFSKGVIGMGGILGAQATVATGMALSQKLKGSDRVSLCIFGEGAANEGAIHEAANLAAIWKLPVIFLIENNQYCISLPINKGQNIAHLADRAAAYGLPGILVDGNDVLAMHDAVAQAVARGRAGEGATWIEAETVRLSGHLAHDPQNYRPKEEIEAAWKNDPIKRFREKLSADGLLTETAYAAMEADVEAEVVAAAGWALKSPLPPPEDAYQDFWA